MEEAPSEEIEMSEKNQNPDFADEEENQTTSQITIESLQMEDSSHDIIEQDITMVMNYNIRNRKFEDTNLFYITKGRNFLLGVLAANTPGENNKEQLAYVANILKLPPDNNLIQIEFWEGNSWITIGFDYKEDLIFCKDKLDNKKDFIKFIQLLPRIIMEQKKQQHKYESTIYFNK